MTILCRSAQPEGMKVSTMSAEIRRRMKTTCEENSQEVHEEILREFMDDLSAMGYPMKWRKKVLESSIRGYMKVLKQVRDGKIQRNREGYTTKMHRRYKRLCDKNRLVCGNEDRRSRQGLGRD